MYEVCQDDEDALKKAMMCRVEPCVRRKSWCPSKLQGIANIGKRQLDDTRNTRQKAVPTVTSQNFLNIVGKVAGMLDSFSELVT